MKKLATLALLVTFLGLALPAVSSAQIFTEGYCDPRLLPGESGNPGPCDLGKATGFVDVAIKWLLIISVPLAAIFIAYGGFLVLTSGGNTGRIESGKKIITSVVIGIIILLMSFIIVRTVFKVLSVEDSSTPTDLR